MCVCVCVCVCVCAFVCAFVSLCLRLCVRVCVRTCVRACKLILTLFIRSAFQPRFTAGRGLSVSYSRFLLQFDRHMAGRCVTVPGRSSIL